MKNLSVLSAAILFAGGLAVANAQTTPGAGPGASPGAATRQEKCWDAATNMVRERSPVETVGAGAGADADAKAGVKTGDAAAAGQAGVGATADAAKRPPEAIGLPNC